MTFFVTLSNKFFLELNNETILSTYQIPYLNVTHVTRHLTFTIDGNRYILHKKEHIKNSKKKQKHTFGLQGITTKKRACPLLRNRRE